MRERWLSLRALRLHVLLLVIVPLCLAAFWWQLHQALAGNSLSWAYTVEWPVFAGIAVWGWWQLVHEDADERAARAMERRDRVRDREAAHLAAAADGTASVTSAGAVTGPGPAGRRSWRAAAAEAQDLSVMTAVDTDRVAAAAREEYLGHLARLAEAESDSPWHRTRRS